jgi:hypothetical protein
MLKLITSIINLVGEFLKGALLPFLSFIQGRKMKELEVVKKEIKGLEEENGRNSAASRAKNSINNLPSSELDSLI